MPENQIDNSDEEASSSEGSRLETPSELCSVGSEIIRTRIPESESTRATTMVLRSFGKDDSAKLLKETTTTTRPTRAS